MKTANGQLLNMALTAAFPMKAWYDGAMVVRDAIRENGRKKAMMGKYFAYQDRFLPDPYLYGMGGLGCLGCPGQGKSCAGCPTMNGLGATYVTEREMELQPRLDGVTDYIPGYGYVTAAIKEALMGKPQSWFDNVNKLQNAFMVLLAQIKEIGEANWNLVRAEMVKRGIAFPTYESVELQASMFLSAAQPGNLLITNTRLPSDTDIYRAQTKVQQITGSVETAKRMFPEIRQNIEQARQSMEEKVRHTELRAPGEAGWEAFKKTIEDQAGKMGLGFGLGIGTIALIAGAVFLLPMLMPRRS